MSLRAGQLWCIDMRVSCDACDVVVYWIHITCRPVLIQYVVEQLCHALMVTHDVTSCCGFTLVHKQKHNTLICDNSNVYTVIVWVDLWHTVANCCNLLVFWLCTPNDMDGEEGGGRLLPVGWYAGLYANPMAPGRKRVRDFFSSSLSTFLQTHQCWSWLPVHSTH